MRLREELPNAETRELRPVLTNSHAKKKPNAVSEGIGSPKAEKAAMKVRVRLSMAARKGSGWVMMPTIVERGAALQRELRRWLGDSCALQWLWQ